MRGENWVDDLLSEVQHVETPTSYLWWSFLCAISAAAGNNYYLTTLKGDLIYKPNIYVMLLGESGLGKAFGINRAKILVQKADVTRVIAGRSSIQGIATELATTKSQPGKPLIDDSRAFITNGELSTAIIADKDALTLLTDWYDGVDNRDWTNTLKSGIEKLKDPYVTCLFGTSPAHFYDSVPQANIEGGYIGRNLIIYEEKRSKDVDLLSEEDENGNDKKIDDILAPKYIPHLQSIASHRGRLTPVKSARDLFNSWRKEWRRTQAKYNDKTGFINRVPDHSLKVAMLLSLARYNSLGIINEFDMQTAITKVTSLVYANERTAGGTGLDPLASQTKQIIGFLLSAENNQLMRRQLLSKGYGNFDTATLDRILDSLLEMGWIRKERYVAGKASDYIIHLSGQPLEQYNVYKGRV